ncbi:MAG: serine/threonine protein kinase [Polyangiaceae bacterium]|nr:serine/threonine protein kinase [Polyangiaceae bacterium]
MFCPRCHRSYTEGETTCAFDGTLLLAGRRIEHVRSKRTQHIGAILAGRWSIQGFLGQGSIARVYLAEDVKTQEPVAVKILEPPWAHDKVARDRFTKAANAAKDVIHDNIVAIQTVTARGDGTPFVVMEHLFGETLAEYIAVRGPMDSEIGLPVMREVALAIEVIHAHGLIHRGLKPENVFLLGDPGDPYAVKVLDVGFGKLRDATVTTNGTVAGGATHMAPEQCVADEVDARTDVYALGLVMYQSFTGKPAFEGEGDELMARSLLAPHRPLRSIVPTIDPGLEAIVDRCLRKDPALRYPTVAALRADIEALAGGHEPDALLESAPPGEVYMPHGAFSRLVARALYRRVGVPPPAFLS